jgi:hypothetical protein
MKPAFAKREVLSSGGGESVAFGISQDVEDQIHLLTILRDTLYSDKILAVLREYSANAWDAHREVGKEDVPIKVVLPTQLDCSVVIRDFGPGLSEDQIARVYTQYGASTKRGTDKKVGMYGIGCKSAFAYNDSFTVTSWFGGMKKMFHAVLDESNRGVITKMYEEECDPEETGIEIKVPVNPKDIHEFHTKASRLFRYFRPLPKINITLPELRFDWNTENGFLSRNRYNGSRYADQWQAVMGCVPYRLNLDQIWAELEEADLTSAAVSLSGGLYFDIGEVAISANREELQYKEKTKQVIVERFKLVLAELVKEVEGITKDEDISDWERRLKIRDFVTSTGLPLNKEHSSWNHSSVTLYDRERPLLEGAAAEPDKTKLRLPKHFVLKQPDRSYTTSGYKTTLQEKRDLLVAKNTRILLKDVIKSYKGYVQHGDYVVTPRGDSTPAEALKELTKFLKDAGLEGVTIVKMSDISYQSYSARTGKVVNKKHSVNCFILGSTRYSHTTTLSKNWEIEAREPDPEDVYVVINRFVPIGHEDGLNGTDFFDQYAKDARVLRLLFDEEMPTIWGLKSTQSRPVDRDKVVGKTYEQWRTETFDALIEKHPEVLKQMEAFWWGQVTVMSTGYWHNSANEDAVREWLDSKLDGRHTTVRFLRDRAKAREVVAAIPRKQRDLVRELASAMRPEKTEAEHRYNLLVQRYPLLKHNDRINQYGLGVFHYEESRNQWLDYINLIDNCPKGA